GGGGGVAGGSAAEGAGAEEGSGMQWARPEMLLWLWGLAPLAGLLALSAWRGRRALARVVSRQTAAQVATGPGGFRRGVRAAALLGAVGRVIVALARPQDTPQEREGERGGGAICSVRE